MKSVIDHPPPHVGDLHRGGDDERWIPLFRAADDIEAHLLAGRLVQAGIETRAIKDRSTADAWLHNGSNPWTPVDLWVRVHHFDDARIVLAEIAFDLLAEDEPAGDWAIRGGWAEQSEDPEIVADARPRSGWYWVAVVVVIAILGVLLQSQLSFIDL